MTTMLIQCGKCHQSFTTAKAFRKHKCLGGKAKPAPTVRP